GEIKERFAHELNFKEEAERRKKQLEGEKKDIIDGAKKVGLQPDAQEKIDTHQEQIDTLGKIKEDRQNKLADAEEERKRLSEKIYRTDEEIKRLTELDSTIASLTESIQSIDKSIAFNQDEIKNIRDDQNSYLTDQERGMIAELNDKIGALGRFDSDKFDPSIVNEILISAGEQIRMKDFTTYTDINGNEHSVIIDYETGQIRDIYETKKGEIIVYGQLSQSHTEQYGQFVMEEFHAKNAVLAEQLEKEIHEKEMQLLMMDAPGLDLELRIAQRDLEQELKRLGERKQTYERKMEVWNKAQVAEEALVKTQESFRNYAEVMMRYCGISITSFAILDITGAAVECPSREDARAQEEKYRTEIATLEERLATAQAAVKAEGIITVAGRYDKEGKIIYEPSFKNDLDRISELEAKVADAQTRRAAVTVSPEDKERIDRLKAEIRVKRLKLAYIDATNPDRIRASPYINEKFAQIEALQKQRELLRDRLVILGPLTEALKTGLDPKKDGINQAEYDKIQAGTSDKVVKVGDRYYLLDANGEKTSIEVALKEKPEAVGTQYEIEPVDSAYQDMEDVGSEFQEVYSEFEKNAQEIGQLETDITRYKERQIQDAIDDLTRIGALSDEAKTQIQTALGTYRSEENLRNSISATESEVTALEEELNKMILQASQEFANIRGDELRITQLTEERKKINLDALAKSFTEAMDKRSAAYAALTNCEQKTPGQCGKERTSYEEASTQVDTTDANWRKKQQEAERLDLQIANYQKKVQETGPVADAYKKKSEELAAARTRLAEQRTLLANINGIKSSDLFGTNEVAIEKDGKKTLLSQLEARNDILLQRQAYVQELNQLYASGAISLETYSSRISDYDREFRFDEAAGEFKLPEQDYGELVKAQQALQKKIAEDDARVEAEKNKAVIDRTFRETTVALKSDAETRRTYNPATKKYEPVIKFKRGREAELKQKYARILARLENDISFKQATGDDKKKLEALRSQIITLIANTNDILAETGGGSVASKADIERQSAYAVRQAELDSIMAQMSAMEIAHRIAQQDLKKIRAYKTEERKAKEAQVANYKQRLDSLEQDFRKKTRALAMQMLRDRLEFETEFAAAAYLTEQYEQHSRTQVTSSQEWTAALEEVMKEWGLQEFKDEFVKGRIQNVFILLNRIKTKPESVTREEITTALDALVEIKNLNGITDGIMVVEYASQLEQALIALGETPGTSSDIRDEISDTTRALESLKERIREERFGEDIDSIIEREMSASGFNIDSEYREKHNGQDREYRKKALERILAVESQRGQLIEDAALRETMALYGDTATKPAEYSDDTKDYISGRITDLTEELKDLETRLSNLNNRDPNGKDPVYQDRILELQRIQAREIAKFEFYADNLAKVDAITAANLHNDIMESVAQFEEDIAESRKYGKPYQVERYRILKEQFDRIARRVKAYELQHKKLCEDSFERCLAKAQAQEVERYQRILQYGWPVEDINEHNTFSTATSHNPMTFRKYRVAQEAIAYYEETLQQMSNSLIQATNKAAAADAEGDIKADHLTGQLEAFHAVLQNQEWMADYNKEKYVRINMNNFNDLKDFLYKQGLVRLWKEAGSALNRGFAEQDYLYSLEKSKMRSLRQAVGQLIEARKKEQATYKARISELEKAIADLEKAEIPDYQKENRLAVLRRALAAIKEEMGTEVDKKSVARLERTDKTAYERLQSFGLIAASGYFKPERLQAVKLDDFKFKTLEYYQGHWLDEILNLGLVLELIVIVLTGGLAMAAGGAARAAILAGGRTLFRRAAARVVGLAVESLVFTTLHKGWQIAKADPSVGATPEEFFATFGKDVLHNMFIMGSLKVLGTYSHSFVGRMGTLGKMAPWIGSRAGGVIGTYAGQTIAFTAEVAFFVGVEQATEVAIHGKEFSWDNVGRSFVSNGVFILGMKGAGMFHARMLRGKVTTVTKEQTLRQTLEQKVTETRSAVGERTTTAKTSNTKTTRQIMDLRTEIRNILEKGGRPVDQKIIETILKEGTVSKARLERLIREVLPTYEMQKYTDAEVGRINRNMKEISSLEKVLQSAGDRTVNIDRRAELEKVLSRDGKLKITAEIREDIFKKGEITKAELERLTGIEYTDAEVRTINRQIKDIPKLIEAQKAAQKELDRFDSKRLNELQSQLEKAKTPEQRALIEAEMGMIEKRRAAQKLENKYTQDKARPNTRESLEIARAQRAEMEASLEYLRQEFRNKRLSGEEFETRRNLLQAQLESADKLIRKYEQANTLTNPRNIKDGEYLEGATDDAIASQKKVIESMERELAEMEKSDAKMPEGADADIAAQKASVMKEKIEGLKRMVKQNEAVNAERKLHKTYNELMDLQVKELELMKQGKRLSPEEIQRKTELEKQRIELEETVKEKMDPNYAENAEKHAREILAMEKDLLEMQKSYLDNIKGEIGESYYDMLMDNIGAQETMIRVAEATAESYKRINDIFRPDQLKDLTVKDKSDLFTDPKDPAKQKNRMTEYDEASEVQKKVYDKLAEELARKEGIDIVEARNRIKQQITEFNQEMTNLEKTMGIEALEAKQAIALMEVHSSQNILLQAATGVGKTAVLTPGFILYELSRGAGKITVWQPNAPTRERGYEATREWVEGKEIRLENGELVMDKKTGKPMREGKRYAEGKEGDVVDLAKLIEEGGLTLETMNKVLNSRVLYLDYITGQNLKMKMETGTPLERDVARRILERIQKESTNLFDEAHLVNKANDLLITMETIRQGKTPEGVRRVAAIEALKDVMEEFVIYDETAGRFTLREFSRDGKTRLFKESGEQFKEELNRINEIKNEIEKLKQEGKDFSERQRELDTLEKGRRSREASEGFSAEAERMFKEAMEQKLGIKIKKGSIEMEVLNKLRDVMTWTEDANYKVYTEAKEAQTILESQNRKVSQNAMEQIIESHTKNGKVTLEELRELTGNEYTEAELNQINTKLEAKTRRPVPVIDRVVAPELSFGDATLETLLHSLTLKKGAAELLDLEVTTKSKKITLAEITKKIEGKKIFMTATEQLEMQSLEANFGKGITKVSELGIARYVEPQMLDQLLRDLTPERAELIKRAYEGNSDLEGRITQVDNLRDVAMDIEGVEIVGRGAENSARVRQYLDEFLPEQARRAARGEPFTERLYIRDTSKSGGQYYEYKYNKETGQYDVRTVGSSEVEMAFMDHPTEKVKIVTNEREALDIKTERSLLQNKMRGSSQAEIAAEIARREALDPSHPDAFKKGRVTFKAVVDGRMTIESLEQLLGRKRAEWDNFEVASVGEDAPRTVRELVRETMLEGLVKIKEGNLQNDMKIVDVLGMDVIRDAKATASPHERVILERLEELFNNHIEGKGQYATDTKSSFGKSTNSLANKLESNSNFFKEQLARSVEARSVLYDSNGRGRLKIELDKFFDIDARTGEPYRLKSEVVIDGKTIKTSELFSKDFLNLNAKTQRSMLDMSDYSKRTIELGKAGEARPLPEAKNFRELQEFIEVMRDAKSYNEFSVGAPPEVVLKTAAPKVEAKVTKAKDGTIEFNGEEISRETITPERAVEVGDIFRNNIAAIRNNQARLDEIEDRLGQIETDMPNYDAESQVEMKYEVFALQMEKLGLVRDNSLLLQENSNIRDLLPETQRENLVAEERFLDLDTAGVDKELQRLALEDIAEMEAREAALAGEVNTLIEDYNLLVKNYETNPDYNSGQAKNDLDALMNRMGPVAERVNMLSESPDRATLVFNMQDMMTQTGKLDQVIAQEKQRILAPPAIPAAPPVAALPAAVPEIVAGLEERAIERTVETLAPEITAEAPMMGARVNSLINNYNEIVKSFEEGRIDAEQVGRDIERLKADIATFRTEIEEMPKTNVIRFAFDEVDQQINKLEPAVAEIEEEIAAIEEEIAPPAVEEVAPPAIGEAPAVPPAPAVTPEQVAALEARVSMAESRSRTTDLRLRDALKTETETKQLNSFLTALSQYKTTGDSAPLQELMKTSAERFTERTQTFEPERQTRLLKAVLEAIRTGDFRTGIDLINTEAKVTLTDEDIKELMEMPYSRIESIWNQIYRNLIADRQGQYQYIATAVKKNLADHSSALRRGEFAENPLADIFSPILNFAYLTGQG
ncbi:hypothetical protein KY340_03035, partial [Candidatus Woesearchaeota archaeon]|nr:hypothetical protein [Candidatus Woesearchaeota archaeon]